MLSLTGVHKTGVFREFTKCHTVYTRSGRYKATFAFAYASRARGRLESEGKRILGRFSERSTRNALRIRSRSKRTWGTSCVNTATNNQRNRASRILITLTTSDTAETSNYSTNDRSEIYTYIRAPPTREKERDDKKLLKEKCKREPNEQSESKYLQVRF